MGGKVMKREVILVELINGSDLSTDKSKTFTNTEKAEKYFSDLVREWIPNVEEDELDVALDDGFYDLILTTKGKKEKKSVVIKAITFEED